MNSDGPDIGNGNGSPSVLTSSQSQVSMASDVHENIDLDETEQSLLEVQALKKHISVFQHKISKS